MQFFSACFVRMYRYHWMTLRLCFWKKRQHYKLPQHLWRFPCYWSGFQLQIDCICEIVAQRAQMYQHPVQLSAHWDQIIPHRDRLWLQCEMRSALEKIHGLKCWNIYIIHTLNAHRFPRIWVDHSKLLLEILRVSHSRRFLFWWVRAPFSITDAALHTKPFDISLWIFTPNASAVSIFLSTWVRYSW